MYTKLSPVYSGPFCDVYKGRSEAGNTVALKVVDLDFVRKPHDFRREVRIIKSLSHPNIARFLDTYALADDQYLVMPFYEKTLADVMKQHQRRKMRFSLENPQQSRLSVRNELPPPDAALIVWGLVDAVQYLHRQQIIHRDIKPSNVFFTDSENVKTPILGDFGISYELARPSVDEPLDRKYTDIATGYYKAPELCFAVADYGPEVDFWSLGILISCLYSADGEPANKKTYDDELEQSPELNDFVLLQGTFEAFGTPNVTDKNSESYWPRLAEPSYHFVDFQYVSHARRPVEVLLPRCEDVEIQGLFSGLTQYANRAIVRR